MENPFLKMPDEEFLYQTCAFMGKDNFIRFVDIIGGNCPNGGCTTGLDKCGKCFYELLKTYGRVVKENKK